MGKKAEQNKLSSGDGGVLVEHNTMYDDNLLPSAEELAKLNAIDPSIIPWIQKRTEIEQEARIEFNKKRLKLPFREMTWAGIDTTLGLIFCAGIIILFMWLSYNLIMSDHEIIGGIFGGLDLTGVLIVLSKFKTRNSK
ncbi:MAG: hypothetical protein K2J82_03285 [Muribaculaceae bacterium]|nr:hypothetical protein [Muribaculaceae bacterium]MDE6753617.1 hypothetical protein [Muribaculaceae bacterium]